jgi:hypothetical protein
MIGEDSSMENTRKRTVLKSRWMNIIIEGSLSRSPAQAGSKGTTVIPTHLLKQGARKSRLKPG